MRLQVIRERPKSRSILKDLTGSLTFKVKVLNPVHMGGTGISLRAKEVITSVEKLRGGIEDKLRSLQQIVEGLPMERDVVSTFALGEERKPSILGSSLKGAIRSRLELSFKGYNGRVPSCFSVTGGRAFVSRKGRSGWRHQRIYPSSTEDRGFPCNYNKYRTVCKVCDIFGAPGLASRVYFPSIEFECDTETFEASFTGYVETIPSNCEAVGTMSFVDMEPYELGLVLIGMGDMKPLLIGFGKYREHREGRMGKIKIEPVGWSFLPISSGIGFEEKERLLRIRNAEELWKVLVAEARKKYSDYWGKVNIPA